jgi:hypothetical protein
LRIIVAADRGVVEILQGLVGPADQAVGDRAHHQRIGVLEPGLGAGEDEIENALGLVIHRARHVETGEIEVDRNAPVGLG